MNSVKVAVVVFAATALMAGCGQKKEEQISLPSDQILSGNAILAPQQPVLEARSVAPADMQPITLVNQAPSGTLIVAEPTTLELKSTVSDKPTDKDIQQALKNAGIYTGPIDGNLGPKSKKAIKAFQEQNGLTADGKVGPRTWKKLSSYLQSAPVAEVSN